MPGNPTNPDEQQQTQNEGTATNLPVPEISRVTIRAPTFIKNEPDLFFIQMEAQFSNAGISRDNSKYNHVIAALDPQYLSMVSDLIRNPPADGTKYESLKTRLINEYTASDQKKLKVLLTEIELGDDKPSHLLRKMRELARNSLTDEALRSLWIDRLPENVRAVVAISNDNLNTCATLADKIIELTAPKHISEIKTDSNNATVLQLQGQIDELTKAFREFRSSRSGINHDNNNENRRSRSKSNSKRPYCRFHYRFGALARKCEQPCRFKKPENNQSNNSEN